ncbi:MAG: response regulator transcription factor [Planctomycetaceae bacterium]|nr:response regulator transcription factor [Planctomycetaceae bacterium]
MNNRPTIFLVDDDPAISRALESVGQLLGLPVLSFSSAEQFLRCYDRSQPGCLILDIKMPDMSGLELQQKLIAEGIRLPVIMISGHADVRIAVEAMSRGAITVLEKPFRLDELLAHIRRAVELDAEYRVAQAQRDQAEALWTQLTPKEREVLELIRAGKSNKQIATDLRISLRAVEDRRARLMKRLQVRTLAELLQLAMPLQERDAASIPPPSGI